MTGDRDRDEEEDGERDIWDWVGEVALGMPTGATAEVRRVCLRGREVITVSSIWEMLGECWVAVVVLVGLGL